MPQLEQEIIDTIAEEGDIEKSEITLDSTLYDLGIDSLTALEILVVLEDKYDIVIPQDRLRNVNTARQIIGVFSDELQNKPKGPTPSSRSPGVRGTGS
jgi:acyl carrier protein